MKEAVTLTRCNTTGPPCIVTVELQLDCRQNDSIAWPARVKPPAGPPPPAGSLWSVTDDDDDRRQMSATVTSLALLHNV